jgi:serine/threonine-protein kinase
MLARDAAIKLIRSDRSDKGAAEAVKRFEHEARVVASLRSQHTSELYDFGVTDDGALYYAMELLDGMDLEDLVTRYGPQPPERVVQFLLHACHSLVEAHEAGLVHRDIKPANLFVTRLGRDYDVIKVLDFGLATKPVDEARKDTKLTQEGFVVGTPAYMAPEQVMGEGALDGRADIYNLGLVAWWLLTGRDAFQATTSTQVMFAHVHSEPEPPSKHTSAAIPPELDEVIMRCLQKRPEDRPQTADELAAALREVPLPPWTRDQAIAWWQSIPAAPPPKVEDAEAIADTRRSPKLLSIDKGDTLDA